MIMIGIRSWRDVTIIDHSNNPTSTALIKSANDDKITDATHMYTEYMIRVTPTWHDLNTKLLCIF